MAKTAAQKKVEKKIVLLDALRIEAKDIDAQIKDVQAEVLALFDSGDVLFDDDEGRTILVESNERVLKATRTQNSSLVFDEQALASKLGEDMWERVSTRSLDKKKLEAHIATGEVSADVVGECATEKVSAPFIKISA
jgi:hypothetical protein